MKNKLSIFPNTLTVANMFFGFWSIIASIEGNFLLACYYVILGALCDAFDGKVARLVKSSSDFGVQFDSLSDIITFGAAPSVLMYKIYTTIYITRYPGLEDFQHLFFLVSFIPLLFAGIRLARFNAELVGYEKSFFSGLPSPAAALTIISFVMFEIEVFGRIMHLKWLFFITIFVSYLMVSRVRYNATPLIFKKKEKIATRFLKLIGVAIGIGAIVVLKSSLLFPVMILFVLWGIAWNLYKRIQKADKLLSGAQNENNN